MSLERIDACVVGGGIIGLAVAAELSRRMAVSWKAFAARAGAWIRPERQRGAAFPPLGDACRMAVEAQQIGEHAEEADGGRLADDRAEDRAAAGAERLPAAPDGCSRRSARG